MPPELEAVARLLAREYEQADKLWKRPAWREMSREWKEQIISLAVATSDALYKFWMTEVIRAARRVRNTGEMTREQITELAEREVMEMLVTAIDQLAKGN